MKIGRTSIYILLFISILLFSSCTDDFKTINSNPNAPTDVPVHANFSTGVRTGVEAGLGDETWMNHTYLGCWSQLISKVQYIDEDKYLFRDSSVNNMFNFTYYSSLKDIQEVVEKAQEQGFPAIEAAARIMRAYFFMRKTDLFGAVPYTKALKGEDGLTAPVYDSQEEIYLGENGIISELKSAESILANNPDKTMLNKSDPVFNGDITGWRKFANSILLRAYMRISRVEPQKAQNGIENIMQNGKPIINDNVDNATLAMPGSKPYRNGMMEALETRTDQGVSKTMVNILKENNDPRLPIYAQDVDDNYGTGDYDGIDTSFVGYQNGSANEAQLGNVSLLGIPIAYDSDRPYLLMTNAEVNFILAEAALKGWNVGGSAQDYYEDGIRASLNQWSRLAQNSPLPDIPGGADAAEITIDEIDSYLEQEAVTLSGSTEEKKAQIITQRWIAFMPNGPQAYSLVRRTGYPARIETKNIPPATPYPGLPLRLPYPTDEMSRNSGNVQEVSQGITQRMYGKKVWWDTRTQLADGSDRPGDGE